MHLILFDIDGTLITGGAGSRSLGLAFSQVYDRSLEEIRAAMKRVAFNGRTDPAIIRDVARESGIDEARFEERMEALYETYLRHLEELSLLPGPRLCPGVMELLAALETRGGTALGLLTGNIEAGARIKLRGFDLNRYFPEGGYGSDSADRGLIAAAARRKFEVLVGHPIPPEEVVVVGDTIHDVACGRVNGFRTIAVGTGGVPMAELAASGPDLLYESLADLAGVLSGINALLPGSGAQPHSPYNR